MSMVPAGKGRGFLWYDNAAEDAPRYGAETRE
jgi:hypothetical protein